VSNPTTYAFLGWQGFGVEHPADWELNRVRGSRRSTYLALDDGDRVRLEVNWRPIGSKVSMEKIVDKQMKTLTKAAGRRKLDLQLDRGGRIGRVKGFEYECFKWTADVGACELVARCKECGRVMLLRVLGSGKEPPTEDARHVFSSLVCYCGKDAERWGTFGLDVEIPTRFELEQSSLRAGVSQLTFSDRRIELRVSRASMGRAILEEKKMVAWCEEHLGQLLRPFDVAWVEESFRGHIGYRGGGEPRSNKRLLGIFRSRRRFGAYCFYCEPTDKIFVVSGDGAGDVDELVDTVRKGLICHR